MQRFVVGICVALLASTVIVADAAEELPIAVYDVFPEHERPALIAAYKKAVASATSDLEAAKSAFARTKNKARKAAALKEIDRIQAEVDLLRKSNDPPYIGVSIEDWQGTEWHIESNTDLPAGALGMCPANIHLARVVDRETAVLWTAHGKYKRCFVAKGWDTSTWREPFELHATMWVTGTISLVDEIDGKTRTYSLVEPFDWAKYKAQNAELPKR